MEHMKWTLLVSGKVQGVYFRASTKEVATQLGLTGYARNLADGRVEVVAEGDVGKLQELKEWCTQGPPSARVSGVRVTESEASVDGFRDFQTR